MPNADASLVETCPAEHATVRVSAPTLEDAYLWHTADADGPTVPAVMEPKP